MMIAWKNLRQKLSAFGADQRGNIALTFLLVALPVIAFVGAAVDYSRANSVKASMQSALDATALMLSKEAATDTDTQRNDNALKYFSKLFDPPQVTGAKLDASNIKVEVTFDPNNNSQILLSASAQLPAQFVQVLGFDTFTVKATSTAKWGITRLRVALVLDNTGSMADNGKMPALQTATKQLLTQLQNAVTVAGDVYVSIIPFVKDVNVGAGNYNTDWVYWGTSSVDSNVNNARRSGSGFGGYRQSSHGMPRMAYAPTWWNGAQHPEHPKQMLCQRRYVQQYELHHAKQLHG